MLPTIAYLSLTNSHLYARQAVVNAYFQKYPNEKKTIYLVNDYGMTPVFSDLIIVQNLFLDKEVLDNSWWAIKIELALQSIKEEYVVWWDSDDLYEPEYTRKISDFFKLNSQFSMAWNHNMIDVNQKGVLFKSFSSAIGTLVIRTDVFKSIFDIFLKRYSERVSFSNKKRLFIPLDFRFRKFLENKYKRVLGEGDWIRAYINHSKSFSAMVNSDVQKETIR